MTAGRSIDYEALTQDALRGVARAVLKQVAETGLPGDHHFYVAFDTQAPGVVLSRRLREKYPDEMMIVLQNQFWDLAPGETFFSVTLKFGGEPKTLQIPYAAVTRFVDPSVQFGLEFEAAVDPEPAAKTVAEPAAADAPAADKPKVVSLDQFRKK